MQEIPLFQGVVDSIDDTLTKETHLLLQKYQYTNHQWFYAANSISGWCLVLFWTNKCRIKNKQVFSELTHFLIHELISPIKHTQQLSQCLGNRKTPIGYVSSEAKDELKLVDNKCTRSTSQQKNRTNTSPGFSSLSLTVFPIELCGYQIDQK